jgi:hypothetical protein
MREMEFDRGNWMEKYVVELRCVVSRSLGCGKSNATCVTNAEMLETTLN